MELLGFPTEYAEVPESVVLPALEAAETAAATRAAVEITAPPKVPVDAGGRHVIGLHGVALPERITPLPGQTFTAFAPLESPQPAPPETVLDRTLRPAVPALQNAARRILALLHRSAKLGLVSGRATIIVALRALRAMRAFAAGATRWSVNFVRQYVRGKVESVKRGVHYTVEAVDGARTAVADAAEAAVAGVTAATSHAFAAPAVRNVPVKHVPARDVPVRHVPVRIFVPKVEVARPVFRLNLAPLVRFVLVLLGIAAASTAGFGIVFAFGRIESAHRQAQLMASRSAEAAARVAYLEWQASHLNRSLRALEQQDTRLRQLLAESVAETRAAQTAAEQAEHTQEQHAERDARPATVAQVPVPRKPAVNLSMIPSIDPSGGGVLTSGFGWRTSPWPEFHRGLDLAQPEGHAVVAAADGTVTMASWNGGFGNFVDIDHHNGFHTYYGHLSRIDVHVGENVRQGELIAAVGQTGEATGPHLHYQLMHNDSPIDPTPFMHGIPAWALQR